MATQHLSQYHGAQLMYRERAGDYDASWHPEYTRRFMDLVGVQPGNRVLDLACGTGLDAIRAARDTGDNGLVVAVDATSEMLEVFREKLRADPDVAQRLKLVQHDVCNLTACPELEENSFDFIICSNAFVLFDKPASVIAHWRNYLKPGGRMAIDVTHENNLRSALLMEAVAERLGVDFPFRRRWIRSKDDFRQMLESEGLVVEKSIALAKEGKGTFYKSVSEADSEFEYLLRTPMLEHIATEDFRTKARPLFREEWMAAATDGNLEFVDELYAYVARKP
ncbi:methyltransferase [Paramyrothecium foliicola]|nr:methyltransferase [Paramyrothecium foliicola]